MEFDSGSFNGKSKVRQKFKFNVTEKSLHLTFLHEYTKRKGRKRSKCGGKEHRSVSRLVKIQQNKM